MGASSEETAFGRRGKTESGRRVWCYIAVLAAALLLAVVAYNAGGEAAPEQGGEDVQAAFDRAHGIRPRTAPKPKAKPEVKAMASYVATGAGNANANGTYVQTGTYSGHPYWQNEHGLKIWADTGSTWFLSANLGGPPYYSATTITGTWSVNSGTAPAPVISPKLTITITLSGAARAYTTPPNKWVLLSDPMTVGGTAVRDDGTAMGVSTVEYSFDSDAAFSTVSVSPTATSLTLSASRTKTELGSLSVGSHTLKVTLKNSGGTVLASATVAFDTVARVAEVTAPDIIASVVLGNSYSIVGGPATFRHWYDESLYVEYLGANAGQGGSRPRTDLAGTDDATAEAYGAAPGTTVWIAGTYTYTVTIGEVGGAVLDTATGNVTITTTVPAPTDPAPDPGGPGGGDVTPPTIAISAPVDGSDLSGPFSVLVTCSDAGSGVHDVRMASVFDNTTILTAPNFGSDYRFPDATGSYDAADLPPGDVTVTVIGRDNALNSASDSVVCHRPADTTPPTVAFVAPVSGASVHGKNVVVQVSATDGGGVARVHIELDGIRQGDILYEPDATTGYYEWTLDVSNWANASSYALCAYAYDNAGNLGSAGVLMTVANSLALAKRYRYTTLLGATQGFTAKNDLVMFDYQADDPETDPRLGYNLFAGIHYGARSVAWADYTPIPVRQSFVLSAAPPLQIAVCLVPRVVVSHWDSLSAEIRRVQTLPDGSRACLLLTPDKVRTFGTSTGFADWIDLAGLSATDMCVLGDKMFVACTDHLRVIDTTAGDLAWTWQSFATDTITSIDVLATDDTDLYIAATLSGGTYKVYSIDGTDYSLRNVCSPTAKVTAMYAASGQLLIGDAAGVISRWDGATLTVESTTGENHISSFCLVDTTVFAGTGNGGKAYRRVSTTWELAATIAAATDLCAVGELDGWCHMGGASATVYREAADLSWGGTYVLDDVDEITAMFNETVQGTEALLIATKAPAGKTALLYRIEVSPESDYAVPSDWPGDTVAHGKAQMGFMPLARATVA